MISLQTNVNSLVAQQNLNTNSIFQSKTIDQLTSGYRINESGDDAAGLAVANKYRSSVAELTQGVANGNDGVASLQIMDGGMSNISQMLDRLKTLAMQSASGSFTGGTAGRATLNSEFQTDIGEIDRQAQSIGLNQGGTFAQNLAVYLGAGTGSQTASNSVVNVNLSTATVDSQSLGLSGVQAVNTNAYDLSSASATSVANVLSANSSPATTTFKLFGAGFSNSTSGTYNNNGLSIAVSTSGVGDVNSLVTAINTAIQTASNLPTGAGAALKAANVTASIVTDASGNQKLAFTSSVSGFEVQGGDATSNALLGFFEPGTTNGTGQVNQQVVTGSALAATFAISATGQTVLTIQGSGITTTGVTVTLTGGTSTIGAVITEINAALSLAGVTGVTASAIGGAVAIGNANGTVTVTETDGTGSAVLGLSTGTDQTLTGAKLVASGAYELGNTGTATVTNFGFGGAITSEQDIAISANDASGDAHALTVKLATGTSTANLDMVIGDINNALQTSNDSTLQQITAVQTNTNGIPGINFVSTLKSFSVSVGATTASTSGAMLGIVDGVGGQGTVTSSVQNGTGGTADISTMSGAQEAVTAITNAVTLLGTAQAEVGKGENQLNFAIALAQSQITNFSAAESNIRDANVAQEAANLTKAQTLQQASIAAMAQANSAPQAVLTLLRG